MIHLVPAWRLYTLRLYWLLYWDVGTVHGYCTPWGCILRVHGNCTPRVCDWMLQASAYSPSKMLALLTYCSYWPLVRCRCGLNYGYNGGWMVGLPPFYWRPQWLLSFWPYCSLLLPSILVALLEKLQLFLSMLHPVVRKQPDIFLEFACKQREEPAMFWFTCRLSWQPYQI